MPKQMVQFTEAFSRELKTAELVERFNGSPFKKKTQVICDSGEWARITITKGELIGHTQTIHVTALTFI